MRAFLPAFHPLGNPVVTESCAVSKINYLCAIYSSIVYFYNHIVFHFGCLYSIRTMCNAFEKLALLYLSVIGTVGFVFIVITYTNTDTEIDLTDVADIVTKLGLKDISRYPYPNDIVARPDLGECCNGLCSGETCYVGDGVVTLNPIHCNNCCNRLTAPNSCIGSDCICYANRVI